MNKKITAAAIAAALSIGTIASVSTAYADRGHVRGVPSQVATVLVGLVANGTLTQAQADALTAALTAAAPAKPVATEPVVAEPAATEPVATEPVAPTSAE